MTEVDMGGFILQDDKGVTEQYVIPEGTKIVPNAVVCFTQAQAGNPSGSFGFGLSSKGDKVVFLDKDGNCIDQVELPAMEKGHRMLVRWTEQRLGEFVSIPHRGRVTVLHRHLH